MWIGPSCFHSWARWVLGEKWIGWVKWCLSTTSFSILVNGTPDGFFQNSRGLRQGDPLSPYLFVIAIVALSCMLKRAVEGGFLTPCEVRGKGNERVDVSHLLFADDIDFLQGFQG